MSSTLDEGELRAFDMFRSVGWNDYICNKPFHHKYDEMLGFGQLAYETGRLDAANVMLSGMQPPEWELLKPMPMNVWEAIRHAERRVGKPCGVKALMTFDVAGNERHLSL